MSSDPRRPMVSVIMIFRNAETFLDEAITSVLGQTHPQIELLLCDDGSDDGSTAVARDWAAKHPDLIRYLEHPGHQWCGMSASRNLGIAAAQGELVAFLDADDVWDPCHLQEQVELLIEHPEAGLACGRALDWYSWDPTSTREESWSLLPAPHGAVVSPPEMLVAQLTDGAYATPICSLTVRRAVLDEVGGCEEAFRSLWEDQVLLAKLHLTSASVISGSTTARYRRHPNSTTARAHRAGAYIRGHQAFLNWLERYVAGTQWSTHHALQLALDAAMTPYRGLTAQVAWGGKAVMLRLLPWTAQRLLRWLLATTRQLARTGSLLPVRMGSLRRVTPISRTFGFDRGLPIDRYFIERFLAENESLIRGRVLEVGDAEYTRRFGGTDVTRSDVLNVKAGNPASTFVADLTDAPELPSDTFDCVVLTQTLHLVYDLQAAVRTLHRVLRPGGAVLATFPGISPLSQDEWKGTWHWALTPLSAARLFGGAFGEDRVQVASYGNVLTSVAFLHGLAAHELKARELQVRDPQFPMLVSVVAVKADGEGS